MNKSHVTLLALLFAGAAVLGAVAVTRTTHLGSAAQQANNAAFTAQTKQLTAYAAALRKQLKTKMPALPKLPKPSPSGAGSGAAGPTIVYHQPPPIVVTIHKHHGDDGGGDGGGGGND